MAFLLLWLRRSAVSFRGQQLSFARAATCARTDRHVLSVRAEDAVAEAPAGKVISVTKLSKQERAKMSYRERHRSRRFR